MSHVLTSTRNPRVVELAKLHDPRRRKAAGLTLVEGPHQLGDVLAFGAGVLEVFALESDDEAFALASAANITATAVSHSVLRRLAGTEHPRGPVGVVRIPAADGVIAGDSVVLWDVGDPRNAGAIVRTAAALGYGVVSTPGTVDLWAPKVIRAAAATQFGARISHLPDASLGPLTAHALRTIATVAHGGTSPEDVERSEQPVAILIGNEAAGLPDDVLEAVDERVTIPLGGGVESLNAAVAAGIVLFALRRR